MTAERPIQFGFLLPPIQLLDICGPIDILTGTQAPILASLDFPDSLVAQGSHMTFHMIGPTLDPVRTFGGTLVVPTCTIFDCPRLDYLLIGGPLPDWAANIPADMKSFIVKRAAEVETLFTTCTGGMVLAATGLLDGIVATTNHGIGDLPMKMFPAVKWDMRKNWVVTGKGGKFWTGAGAVAGMDMMAHWVDVKFGKEILRTVCAGLDYTPRDIDGKFVEV